MSLLKNVLNSKKVMLGIVLTLAMIVSVISVALVDNTANAGGDTIQYNNKVFSEKLYKKTKKIGFGPVGTQIVKDKKTVKKVYALLAKMKLKAKEPNPNEDVKDGFVCVVIHTKDGKKKIYRFQGKEMNRKYIITQNNPIDKIREIYKAFGN